MVVKILRLGQKPEEKIYEVTCYYCKTYYSFQQSDAVRHTGQLDGNYLTINCPHCDIKNSVKK